MILKIFKNKKNIFLIVFAIVAAVLLFNSSFFALLHNSVKMRKLNERISALDAEYNELQAEYNKILSGNQSYLEEAARVNYNMAREGEIEFRIKK